MKEVYLVKWGVGDYEEYRVLNSGTVFVNLSSAEKELKRIEDYNSSTDPFPFNHCTETEFLTSLADGLIVEEEINTYDNWVIEQYMKMEFRGAWIETLTITD